MTFGYDVDPGAVCSIKKWDETNVFACMILFAYGGIKRQDFAVPDIEEQLSKMVQNEVEKKFDSLAFTNVVDLRYIALIASEALKNCNAKIREANSLLGCKSYVGGVIGFCDGQDVLVIPFGGGHAYIHTESVVKPINPKPETELIDDALGCSEEWKLKYFQGHINTNTRLIFTSGYIVPDELFQILQEHDSAAAGYQNTLAMQIRTALQKRSLATMEVRV